MKPIATILTFLLPATLAFSTSLKKPDAEQTTTLGNQDFAVRLFQQVNKAGVNNNLLLAPYSISSALTMTYLGAANETYFAMGKTLGLLDIGLAKNGFKKLNPMIISAKATDGYELQIANKVWGDKKSEFAPQFTADLTEFFNSSMQTVDFADEPTSRNAINQWVEQNTAGKIKDLIPGGMLDGNTALVLTNAVYFLGEWQDKFIYTNKADFTLLDGTKKSVDMMTGEKHGNDYFDTKLDASVIELPYFSKSLNKSASMILVVPEKNDGLEKLVNSISTQEILEINDNLKNKAAPTSFDMFSGPVELTMPKFKFESSIDLSNTLKAMGMEIAFSDFADFSNMVTNRDIKISKVLHKTFIDLDESGTEAAGATAVIMVEKGMISQPRRITVDHPFMFMIRDNATGNILFMGQVTNP